jgi:hypothetical protein
MLAGLVVVAVASATTSWATTTPPAPTASVATYVQGTELPVTTVSAAWSKVTPGCAGRLEASGPTVSGTTTVATGGFTSRWFRPRGGQLLSLTAGQGGDRRWQPFAEGFALGVRLRTHHSQWSPWWHLRMDVQPQSPPLPQLLIEFSAGMGVTLLELPRKGHPLPEQQLQVRLIDRITSTASVDDTFGVAMGC